MQACRAGSKPSTNTAVRTWWTGGVWSTLTTSVGFSRNQGLENTAMSISLQLPVPLAYSSVLNGHERRKHNTVAIILMIASLCTRQHWLWHDIKDRSVREAGSSQLSLLEHLCNGNRQWCKQLNYSFFFFFLSPFSDFFKKHSLLISSESSQIYSKMTQSQREKVQSATCVRGLWGNPIPSPYEIYYFLIMKEQGCRWQSPDGHKS